MRFGADKEGGGAIIRRLVAWMMRLDMSVIQTTYQVDVWGVNERGQREVIGVGPDCWASALPYELDLCINLQKIGPRRVGRSEISLFGLSEADPFEFNYPVFRRTLWA